LFSHFYCGKSVTLALTETSVRLMCLGGEIYMRRIAALHTDSAHQDAPSNTILIVNEYSL